MYLWSHWDGWLWGSGAPPPDQTHQAWLSLPGQQPGHSLQIHINYLQSKFANCSFRIAISNPGGISSLQTLPAFNWLGSSTNGSCGSPAAKAWQVSRHTPTLVLSLTLSMMPLSSEKLPPTVVPWPHIFSSTEFREEMPPSLWDTRHANIWYLTAEARPGIVGAATFPRQKVASGMWGMSEDSSGVIWSTNNCRKVSQHHTYSYSVYWYEIMVFYWNLLLERLQIHAAHQVEVLEIMKLKT